MGFTPSTDQKKSLAFSLLIYAAMLLILFFIRFWPPSNLAELTGGGGGGSSQGYSGANGGSGVVIIRYSDAYAPATSTTGSPTITVSGGYRVYKYTSSGSITF